jgi:flagellar biosynthesis anti-sigma factor FlgM
MKVNSTNLSSPASAEALGTQQTGQTGQVSGTVKGSGANAASATQGDDIHLSELVRSLRSLAADSPERQMRIEQIARSYAGGSYQVDPPATASKIIDEANQYRDGLHRHAWQASEDPNTDSGVAQRFAVAFT